MDHRSFVETSVLLASGALLGGVPDAPHSECQCPRRRPRSARAEARVRAPRHVWTLALLLGAGWVRANAQMPMRGAPEEHLPPNITQLTAFGERAALSPDGRRIAFMSKSFGDAFEIDLQTRLIRLLTGHFRHAGFLRVQYLPNGDYVLIGARDFRDIGATR